MDQEELRQAIEAIGNPELRAQVADGNFDSLVGIHLSDEERGLLRAVANDDPEVAGFDLVSYPGVYVEEGSNCTVSIPGVTDPLSWREGRFSVGRDRRRPAD